MGVTPWQIMADIWPFFEHAYISVRSRGAPAAGHTGVERGAKMRPAGPGWRTRPQGRKQNVGAGSLVNRRNRRQHTVPLAGVPDRCLAGAHRGSAYDRRVRLLKYDQETRGLSCGYLGGRTLFQEGRTAF